MRLTIFGFDSLQPSAVAADEAVEGFELDVILHFEFSNTLDGLDGGGMILALVARWLCAAFTDSGTEPVPKRLPLKTNGLGLR